MDFSKLKSQKGKNLTALTEKLESMNKSSGQQKDDRIYKPGFSKEEGKGDAVVRFLPNKHGEPFVRLYSHAFQGKGGWYIENSRSTIDQEDPVGISNRAYWARGEAEGNEALKNIVKSRKRNTKYYANVYVIKDKYNPAAVGKVMIYEFGTQIFKMLEAAAKPEFEDDTPLDAFDMWEGANFRIKIVGKEMPGRNGGKQVVPNYEKSEFDSKSEFLDSDEEREEIFEKTHDLTQLIKIKSFDELAKQFKRATGEAHDALAEATPGQVAAEKVIQQEDLASQQTQAKQSQSVSSVMDEEDDDDDIMRQFKALAGG